MPLTSALNPDVYRSVLQMLADWSCVWRQVETSLSRRTLGQVERYRLCPCTLIPAMVVMCLFVWWSMHLLNHKQHLLISVSFFLQRGWVVAQRPTIRPWIVALSWRPCTELNSFSPPFTNVSFDKVKKSFFFFFFLLWPTSFLLNHTGINRVICTLG